MDGEVGLGAEAGGGVDDVIGVDAEQAFVEGPVAELAEGEAVAGVVVVADAPGDDGGGGTAVCT